jgi:hypothetical protein
MRLDSGFRFQSSSGPALIYGASIQDRVIPTSKTIVVNEVRLSKFSVSPLLGCAFEF